MAIQIHSDSLEFNAKRPGNVPFRYRKALMNW